MSEAPPTWRLVLVRASPAPAVDVAPLLGGPPPTPLPAIVMRGHTMEEILPLARALRAAGATVALVEAEAGACRWHEAELAALRCVDCGAWICGRCTMETGGLHCPPCGARLATRARNARLRRLFALFLFAAFLYEVERYLRAEDEALTPPVRVAIFQLVPPHLADHPIIAALNRNDDWLGRSLLDIEPFYVQEYRRYAGGTGSPVSITIVPPWRVDVRPPDVVSPDLPFWTRAYRAWQHPRYFHDIARQHGVDPDDYGARVYVVYTDQPGDVASESRGSRRGRISVPYISLRERNLGYDVVTVAHELAHVLGTSDRYDPETFLSSWPEGYVQPFTQPTWPQRWGELMAVDIPMSPTTEREPRSLFIERFGYASAAELGWISRAQADTWYTPRLDTPDSVLDAIRRARDSAQPARAATAPECDPETFPTSEAEEAP